MNKKSVLLFFVMSLQVTNILADMSGWKTLLGVIGTAYVADTGSRMLEKKYVEGRSASEGLDSPVKPVNKKESDEEEDRAVIGLNIFGAEVDVSYRQNVGWTRFVESFRVRAEVDGRKAFTLLAVYVAAKYTKVA